MRDSSRLASIGRNSGFIISNKSDGKVGEYLFITHSQNRKVEQAILYLYVLRRSLVYLSGDPICTRAEAGTLEAIR